MNRPAFDGGESGLTWMWLRIATAAGTMLWIGFGLGLAWLFNAIF